MENNQKFEQIIKIIGLIILALILTSIVGILLQAIFRLIVFVVVLACLRKFRNKRRSSYFIRRTKNTRKSRRKRSRKI